MLKKLLNIFIQFTLISHSPASPTRNNLSASPLQPIFPAFVPLSSYKFKYIIKIKILNMSERLEESESGENNVPKREYFP